MKNSSDWLALIEPVSLVWKRTREIASKPEMFVGGTESGDIIQGGMTLFYTPA
jgi:hypothetical protein